MTNARSGNAVLEIIITLLRILFGILVGFFGCIAVLNAPYQLLELNSSLADAGPVALGSLLVGVVMLWVGWRLIRGSRAEMRRP